MSLCDPYNNTEYKILLRSAIYASCIAIIQMNLSASECKWNPVQW